MLSSGHRRSPSERKPGRQWERGPAHPGTDVPPQSRPGTREAQGQSGALLGELWPPCWASGDGCSAKPQGSRLLGRVPGVAPQRLTRFLPPLPAPWPQRRSSAAPGCAQTWRRNCRLQRSWTLETRPWAGSFSAFPSLLRLFSCLPGGACLWGGGGLGADATARCLQVCIVCPLNSPGIPSHCCPHRAFLPQHQRGWWSWMQTSACPLLKGGCPKERSWGVRGRLGLAPVTARASSPPTPRVSGTGDQAKVSALVGVSAWPGVTGSLLMSLCRWGLCLFCQCATSRVQVPCTAGHPPWGPSCRRWFAPERSCDNIRLY